MQLLIVADAPVPHPFMNYRADALIHYLTMQGHRVSVVCAEPFEDSKDKLKDYVDREVGFFYTHKFKALKRFPDLLNRINIFYGMLKESKHLLRSNDFDVIRPISFLPSLAVSLLENYKNDAPIVTNLSDFYSELYSEFQLPLAGLFTMLLKKAEGRVLDKSTAFIVDSPVQREIWKRRGLDRSKCVVIPHGIPHYSKDLSDVQDIAQEIRNYFGIKEDQKLVFYIGDISKLDGLDVLVFAAKILIKQKVNLKFMIVGSGNHNYMLGLKRLVRVLGLSDIFIFVDKIKHDLVPYYLAAANICVAPFRLTLTSNSSLPNKILEYLSSDKPIVATRGKGIEEMLGNSIRFTNPDDPRDLANAIFQLITNDQMRIEMMRNIAKIKCKLSWSKIVQQEERLIKSVIEQNVNDYTTHDYIPSLDTISNN